MGRPVRLFARSSPAAAGGVPCAPRFAIVTAMRSVKRTGRQWFALLSAAAANVACHPNSSMRVSADFEGGSGVVVSRPWRDAVTIVLSSEPVGAERLWFYVRIDSDTVIQPWLVVEKDQGTHQKNWDVVRPVFSTDGRDWVRATEVRHERSLWRRARRRQATFRFRAPMASKTLWVAYSYPYTPTMLSSYLKSLEGDARVIRSTLGVSARGRQIPRLSIGSLSDPGNSLRPRIWVVAREHSGETPSSYVLEGLVDALLEAKAGERLLARYRLEIVPMINMDGAAEGRYYRTPDGTDLAQDWRSFRSPEMRALHDAMRSDLEAGQVALLLNLHSANSPESHFFLETPPEWLAPHLSRLQQALLKAADGLHPQLQARTTVRTWDLPVIASNFLNQEYGVLCFYSESNYSIGADGSVVTRESLRSLGASLVEALDKAMPTG